MREWGTDLRTDTPSYRDARTHLKRLKGHIYLSWLLCLRFIIPYLFLGSGPEGDVLAEYRSHRLSLLFSFGDGPMTPALNAAPPYVESGAAWR